MMHLDEGKRNIFAIMKQQILETIRTYLPVPDNSFYKLVYHTDNMDL